MKGIFLLIVAVVFIEVDAQTQRPANIEIPITVFDNSGMPFSSRILTCGIDTMATDSIDSFLGEDWVMCPFAGNNSDCPPYDHFEAVLDIPAEPPYLLLFGSFKDFRYGVVPYSSIKTYTIYYQLHGAATALYISWDFPEGVTGVLQDAAGGIILNYPMPDSGTFTHPYFFIFNYVRLILTYQDVTPVELFSFNAALSENNVLLDWTTSTETNNSGFAVERMSVENPKSEFRNSNWTEICFVPGFGTTTEPKSYSFIDEDVTNGIYKYRLKQIDFDGTFTYSNEIEVEVDFTPKEFVLYQNYPNPFNPSTIIKFEIPNVETTRRVVFTTLKVYDVLGNEVATLVNEEKQPGVYEVEFDASSLASGMYLYKLQAGTFVQTKKMILLK